MRPVAVAIVTSLVGVGLGLGCTCKPSQQCKVVAPIVDAHCTEILRAHDPKSNPLASDVVCPFQKGRASVCPKFPVRPLKNDCVDLHVGPAGTAAGIPYEDEMLLTAVFLDNGVFNECRAIFREPIFADAMRRIRFMPDEEILKAWPTIEQPLDDTQRGMATVFVGIRDWSYCNEELADEPSGYIHGAFSPESRHLVLYRTACEALSIYDENLGELDLGYRFALIAAHEVGHAIDMMTGDLVDETRCRSREGRATIYGTFIAECYSQLFRKLLNEDWKSRVDTELAGCLRKRWTTAESHLREIRCRATHDEKDADAAARRLPHALGAALGCRGL